jgi:hypothetical protein
MSGPIAGPSCHLEPPAPDRAEKRAPAQAISILQAVSVSNRDAKCGFVFLFMGGDSCLCATAPGS